MLDAPTNVGKQLVSLVVSIDGTLRERTKAELRIVASTASMLEEPSLKVRGTNLLYLQHVVLRNKATLKVDKPTRK